MRISLLFQFSYSVASSKIVIVLSTTITFIMDYTNHTTGEVTTENLYQSINQDKNLIEKLENYHTETGNTSVITEWNGKTHTFIRVSEDEWENPAWDSLGTH